MKRQWISVFNKWTTVQKIKRFRRASIDRAAFALYINSMETQNTQSPDFREKLIIGASFERQKAKRIPWRKDFIDRPGVLLTVSGTGEIFFEDAHQQLTAGDLVLYDPLPQHLFAGDPEFLLVSSAGKHSEGVPAHPVQHRSSRSAAGAF